MAELVIHQRSRRHCRSCNGYARFILCRVCRIRTPRSIRRALYDIDRVLRLRHMTMEGYG